MVHIEPKHFPFALCLLPFLVMGIGFPVTIQDWLHDRLQPGDGISILAGTTFVILWEGAILLSIKAKRRKGKEHLLGRSLSSWYWAPPLTFITGAACGLIFIS